MTGTQGLLMILFPMFAGFQISLYLISILIGFNFGGNFSLFPTMTADTFGSKYISQNYGWVFLSYGLGGVLGPTLGGKLGDMGNFPLAFTICGAFCFLACVAALLTRKPKMNESQLTL